MPMPDVSVIIPTHNRADRLARALAALGRQTAPAESFEVLVADDGSTDATRAVLEEGRFAGRLTPLFLPHDGVSRARNEAARVACGVVLLFLGDDMEADPDLVAAHRAAHRRHPAENVGVLGHIAWSPDLPPAAFRRFLGEPDCPYQFSFTGFDPADVPLGRMYGSHHSVKRSFFARHGGFDPAFRWPAFEDVELECRYRKTGFRLVYAPEARLYHHHSHNLASFCRRMRLVGRVAVPLHRKHPESVLVTNIGTLLTLPVREAALEAKIAALAAEEERLEAQPPESAAWMDAYARLRAGWSEALFEAAALGAQEAARESGWTDLTALVRARGCRPGRPGRRRLAITLGATPREDGLAIVPTEDTRYAPVRVAGRDGVRLPTSPRAPAFLHLRLDPDFTAAVEGGVCVRVDYLDIGSYEWWLDYDSADMQVQVVPSLPGAFKRTARTVTHRDSGRWRQAIFRLADGLFLGRCNGADFRLAVPPHAGPGLCLHRITVFADTRPEEDTGPGEPAEAESGREGAALAPVAFPAEAAPDVSIILPVHGLAAYTADCLHSLRETTEGRYEVIVVDNGSPDETPAFLAQCRGVRVWRSETNDGFAAACNRGARMARGAWLLFLNNDMLLLPGWLTALRRAQETHAEAGAVGAKLLFPRLGRVQHAGVAFAESAPYHAFAYYPPHHPAVARTRRVPAVTGACLLVRRRDFWQVGGFDEAYRNGFEDIDLCLKLARQGLGSLYCAESVLYHYESSTPGRFDRNRENLALFQARWARELPGLLARGGLDGPPGQRSAGTGLAVYEEGGRGSSALEGGRR